MQARTKTFDKIIKSITKVFNPYMQAMYMFLFNGFYNKNNTNQDVW